MRTRMWLRIASLAAAIVLGATVNAAAAPSTITYVGELRADNGLGYTGDVQVSASLWDAASNGNAVRAAEDLGIVSVDRGTLRLEIGQSGTSIEDILAANSDVWLELNIDGITLSPRQRLQSVPFAEWSADAAHLGGVEAADYLTQADLSALIATATNSAMAPMDPEAGDLWWDQDNQNLFVWDSGTMDWVSVNVTDVFPENLPGNGLAAASNGVLSNEFENVSYLWSTGAPIADATLVGPGTPAQAVNSVVEGSQSYIYNLQIETNFSLSSSNSITMTLFPPPALGVDPIELRSESLPFGTYGNIWTVLNTPELEELLFANPAGDWTLAIVDNDNNLSDAGPNVAGDLVSFAVVYDVVRSDNLQAFGTLDVDTLVVTDTLDADVNTSQDIWEVDGDLVVQQEFIRTVQYTDWNNDSNDTSSIHSNRQAFFTKKYDETYIYVEWTDGWRHNTTGSRYKEFRFRVKDSGASFNTGDARCNSPSGSDTCRWYSYTENSSNGYGDTQNTVRCVCNKIEGLSGVPEVNGGTNIPAGDYEIAMFSSSTSSNLGVGAPHSHVTIYEIWPSDSASPQ